jgi:CHAD domain-containing protein
VRLERVTKEIDGVRKANDIECVHRMRVASRRLRTALRLFEKCFPGKPLRRWQREMRAITRALGKARDLDVQIESVREFERSLRDPRNRPGVRRLVLRLSQKRARAQRKVTSRLTDFQASGASESMTTALSPLVVQSDSLGPAPELLQDARSWIQRGLNDLLKYEPYVTKPKAVKELHAMRIAAKHLRYMLEILEPLFAGRRETDDGRRADSAGLRSPVSGPIEAAKQVQSLLGTLHDCDVWLELLPRFLERESERSLDHHGHGREFKRLAPGLERFRLSVVRLRGRTYRRFAAFWQETRSNRTWESVIANVEREP